MEGRGRSVRGMDVTQRSEVVDFLKLATENRLRILWALGEDPMRVSDVERVLRIANATRELKALERLGLVARSGDYYYRLTGAGEWVVRRQLGRIQTFVSHIALFNKYDWAWVPPGMEPRPLLKDGQLRRGSHANVVEFENAVSVAKAHLFRMVERPLPGRPLPSLANERLAEVRLIWAAEAISPAVVAEAVAALEKARPHVRLSLLPRVPVVMSINTTRAYLFLHERENGLDANTLLFTEEPEGIEWCRKVFDHHERRANAIYDSDIHRPEELPVNLDRKVPWVTGTPPNE